jgi:Protein of unknown function (DUF2865)
MAVVRRRSKVICVKRFAARPRNPRPWAAAALSFAFLTLAADETPAQNAGCARCGASVAPPPVAAGQQKAIFVERTRRNERWTLKTSLRLSTQPGRKMGSDYPICVRTCDGAFFPVSYFGADSRADTLEEVCRSLCPNAVVALYSFPFGGTVDEAVSSTGEPYSHLPNANKFALSYEPTCSCRAPGQSWAEALAAAEAKYGRHSRDLLVSVEAAERMSRPVQDPRAKSAPPDPAQPRAEPPVAPPPGLDINGVDTSLSAAAAAISRESSGIRDEDGQSATSFGLKQGRTVEETAADGSVRRVRVLPSTFGPQ